nr:immunoglobulin heavy chain junction region [Mus musculus]
SCARQNYGSLFDY